MNVQNRPCAAPGLTSFRYPSRYGGYIMIGAKDANDAVREAQRSVDSKVIPGYLQVWDGKQYVPTAAGEGNAPENLRDDKGRQLIHGAWYSLYNTDARSPYNSAMGGILAQFICDDAEAEPSFTDETEQDVRLTGFDRACLQQCDAASKAGVIP